MSETSVVLVSHPDLLSLDRSKWKAFVKRVKGIAKLKGHPLAVAVPAMGYTHFNGKQFLRQAWIAFEFEDWKEHNSFVVKVKRIPGIQISACSKLGWYDLASNFGIYGYGDARRKRTRPAHSPTPDGPLPIPPTLPTPPSSGPS